MKNQIGFRRNGDVNLHEITEAEFKKVAGEIIKHNGSYVLAEGEATGSQHLITVKNPYDLQIKKDAWGNTYFQITDIAELTHTHDHAPTFTPKKVWYKQVNEREQDHFAGSLTRKVID